MSALPERTPAPSSCSGRGCSGFRNVLLPGGYVICPTCDWPAHVQRQRPAGGTVRG